MTSTFSVDVEIISIQLATQETCVESQTVLDPTDLFSIPTRIPKPFPKNHWGSEFQRHSEKERKHGMRRSFLITLGIFLTN